MGAVEKTPKHHIPVPTDGPLRMRDARAFPRKNWDADTHSGAVPDNRYSDDERLRGMPKRGGA